MENENKKVIISGINIPFFDLVILLVKLALAAIHAIILLSFIFAAFTSIFGGMFNFFMFRGSM